MKTSNSIPTPGDIFPRVKHTVEQNDAPISSPIDMLVIENADAMTSINDGYTADDREKLDSLLGQMMVSLEQLNLTHDVLGEIELNGDDALLTNKVVARDILHLRDLQGAYNSAIATSNQLPVNGNSPHAQLAHLQTQLNQHIDAITIKTADGEQPIDFSALEVKKKSPTYAQYLGHTEAIGPIVDAEEITSEDEPAASPINDNTSAPPVVQEVKPATKTESPNDFSAATKSPNDFSMAAEAPKASGNDFSAADQRITVTPIFSELAKKYGIILDEPAVDNPNDFSMAATKTPDNDPNDFSAATKTPDNNGNDFSMAQQSHDDGNDFSFATETPNNSGNDFSMAVEAAHDSANDFSMATAHSSEQNTQPERLSGMEKIKNGLFAASMKLMQMPKMPKMPKKFAEKHAIRKAEKEVERAQETEQQKSKRRHAKVIMGGLALGLTIAGTAALYNVGRDYGWFDGSGGLLGDAVPDTHAPQFDHQPSDIPAVDTPPTPDTIPPVDQSPNTLDLSKYSEAFTVPFGGGGAELLQQLGVKPEQALSKWQQIAPDLLDKFPNDFYDKTEDGSVAGIMRPDELPEDVQRFIAKKLGIK